MVTWRDKAGESNRSTSHSLCGAEQPRLHAIVRGARGRQDGSVRQQRRHGVGRAPESRSNEITSKPWSAPS